MLRFNQQAYIEEFHSGTIDIVPEFLLFTALTFL
jgi:hypothetical protein